ncbi:MAG: hypothetical protein AB7K24_20665 [Gemmataceae bacterium]
MTRRGLRNLWFPLGILLLAVCARAEEPSDLPVLSGQEALRKARVGGKYQMLLRQFKAPQDAEKFSDFRDLGQREIQDYAGLTDLPAGHWVYVYPSWYIWRETAGEQTVKRRYGPEQAAGPPDTPRAGDLATAWASRTADGEDEWLLLEYAEPVVPAAVMVHETYNPGALYRVCVYKLDGTEVEVWKGKDPTPPGSGSGISEIPIKVNFKINRVKIFFDSKAVPGWNEIDAVGLRDAADKTHWAETVDSSSAYGVPVPQVIRQVAVQVPAPQPVAQPAPQPQPQPMPPVKDPRDERIRQLEKEIQELKDAMKALKDKVDQKKN